MSLVLFTRKFISLDSATEDGRRAGGVIEGGSGKVT